MKVLVTGGSGFLGRDVVAALLDAGHGVRSLDRTPRDLPAGVESITADLAAGGDLSAAFEGVDVVVHLAASLQGSPEQIIRNTVDGTRHLLEAMSKSQTRRLVHASSFTVYNRAKIGDTISEDSPTHDDASMQQVDGYARAKTMQEKLVRDTARQHGWTLTVLRAAVIWGPGKWGQFLLGPRIGPLQLVIAPASKARLAYVENVADAFVKAVERTTTPGETVVNVVDDPTTTVMQYAKAIKLRVGGVLVPAPYGIGLYKAKAASLLTGGSAKLPYFLQPGRIAAMHKPMSWSNQKLRQTLGWTPRYTFEQAIGRAMAKEGSR